MRGDRFEWNSDRSRANEAKHGVGFATAQFAFADPRRVIAIDAEHSRGESRYFASAPLQVAFSLSDSRIDSASFASSGPGTGVKASRSMSAKIRYTDEPLGNPRVVPDFLPAPHELVFREEGVKVTLALSKRSVDFFKREAAKHNTQYQRMIRRLLDAYAEHHAETTSVRPMRKERTGQPSRERHR